MMIGCHFLTNKEITEFNLIGHSGKNLKGEKTHIGAFLNTLGKVNLLSRKLNLTMVIFREAFTLSRTIIEISKPKYILKAVPGFIDLITEKFLPNNEEEKR